MHRKLPAFPGTGRNCNSCDCCECVNSEVLDLSTVPCFGLAAFSETAAAAASGGDSGSDQDGEQFSDAEWEAENNVAVDDKPTNSHIPVMSRALSSLMGLYASGSSESEGKTTYTVSVMLYICG